MWSFVALTMRPRHGLKFVFPDSVSYHKFVFEPSNAVESKSITQSHKESGGIVLTFLSFNSTEKCARETRTEKSRKAKYVSGLTCAVYT